ncbi:MAG: PEGA domain-containing protein [Candidatus Daviesbacteria bacterium]|nr:PEGA domain-containing protein [Candidatus Daviesbacteria bacterium]
MRRKLFLLLVFICLILLIIQFGKQQLTDILGVTSKGGLKIVSVPIEAAVYINGQEVGKTPYRDDNLDVGEYSVKISSNDSSWEGKISLNKGTLSVINRSLSPNTASSSGESLVLDKGQGIIITSTPGGSDISVDGKLVGQSPLSISDLSSGSHSFDVSHDGYLSRRVDVIVPANLSLHINVDLALIAVKENNVITPTVAVVKKIVIKQTPLGYLRLREGPSINTKEVGQVSAGEELNIVSESGSWIKVKLKDNLEGWVSAQYIQRLN